MLCADVGFNASVTIEELGSPDKIIQGFAPELYGSPLSVSGHFLQHHLCWWACAEQYVSKAQPNFTSG